MLSIPDVKSSAAGSVELTISRPQGQAGYINALIITRSSTTLSNNLKQFNDVKIYPVPTKNYVNLSNLPVQSQIAVFDITGKKLIETANGNNPEIQVNVKSLNSGTYIFKIFNSSSTIKSYKIIKE